MIGNLDEFVKALSSPDADVAADAAEALLASAASLSGAPPAQLLAAITMPVGLPHTSILNLARAWPRLEMSRATLDAIRQTTHLGERERLAWLLKTVLAPEHASEAISRILDRAEADEVRLWIVEAVERLIFGGSIGWDQLGGVIAMLAQSPSPALRAKLASVLTALPWRATNVQWLEPLLRDADPEVVSSAAHTLARHPDATRQLRPLTLEQLRANPNSLIRHAAASLDAALGQQSSDRGTG